jgi:hypothetical protein
MHSCPAVLHAKGVSLIIIVEVILMVTKDQAYIPIWPSGSGRGSCSTFGISALRVNKDETFNPFKFFRNPAGALAGK